MLFELGLLSFNGFYSIIIFLLISTVIELLKLNISFKETHLFQISKLTLNCFIQHMNNSIIRCCQFRSNSSVDIVK